MSMKLDDFPPGSQVVVDAAMHLLYAEDAQGQVIYPTAPDISGLKAEVARLYARYPMAKVLAGCDPNTAFACSLLYPLFLAAERAGWLPAERPADPVEVAAGAIKKALFIIDQGDIYDTDAERNFADSRQVRGLREALAALRQTRG